MVNIKALKSKRSRVRACISRAHNFCSTINDNTTLEDLEARFKALESYWQHYILIEDEMCEVEKDDEEAEAMEGETFEQYEAKYLAIFSTLLKAIKARKSQPESPEETLEKLAGQQTTLLSQLGALVPKTNDVALPKIMIPKFFGDYSKWTAFRDLFIGSVDRKTNLTKTQKFYYLVSFLDGEAFNLIKNIPISEDYYMEAWDKLESRYDRPHLCAYSYIQSFLKLPVNNASTYKGLRKILDGADECLRGLKSIDMNSRDPWLIYLLLSKLDAASRQLWSEEVGSKPNVSIYVFLEFLEKRYTYLESNEMLGTASTTKITSFRSNVSRTSLPTCLKCQQQHHLFQCDDFKSLNIDDKRKFIKDNVLCFNCLKAGHNAAACSSKFSCRFCDNRHHSLVHYTNASSNTNSDFASNTRFVYSGPTHMEPPCNSTNLILNSSETTQLPLLNRNMQSISSIVTNNHVTSNSHPQVILPTALVRVQDKFGNFVNLRSLIDTGSQVSFITESCVQLLGLPRLNGRLSIMGVSSTKAGATKGQVKLNVYSSQNMEMVTLNAFILKTITADISSYSISGLKKELFSTINLADPNFNQAGAVDILLGADIVWSILRSGKIPLNTSGLYAINSTFGWIISGQIPSTPLSSNVTSCVISTDIDKMLHRFWELEECAIKKKRTNFRKQ